MLSRNSAMSSVMSFILPTIECVTAAICTVMALIFSMLVMVVSMSSACLSMLAIMSCWYFSFIFCVVPCMLIWNGIEVCSIGVPCGRVMACTRPTPSVRKIALAILSITRKSAELRRS